MAHYKYPTEFDLSSSNGLINLIVALNSATSGWLMNMMLMSVFIIFASGFYYSKGDFWGALSVGGFALFIISIVFWVSGIISTPIFTLCTAITIITFAGLFIHPD